MRLALRWVLEQRRVSGQKLERVMGHVTYITLVRRSLSSAFTVVYKFQQAHFNEPTFLWACCLAELEHFLNAMPLLESNWSLSWSGTVMATDACEGVYRVVSGEFSHSVVSVWERRLERHRFCLMSALQGRKHALAELDPFRAAETVEDYSGECEESF